MGEGPLATELQMRGAVTQSLCISMKVTIKEGFCQGGRGGARASREGATHEQESREVELGRRQASWNGWDQAGTDLTFALIPGRVDGAPGDSPT